MSGTHLVAGDYRWGKNPSRSFPSDMSLGKAPTCRQGKGLLAYDDQAFLLQTLGTEGVLLINDYVLGATNGSGDIKDALYKLLYSLRFVSLLLPKTRTFALGFVVSHDREEVETVLSSSFERVDNEWEGSALPEASLLFYRATPTYLSKMVQDNPSENKPANGLTNGLSIDDIDANGYLISNVEQDNESERPYDVDVSQRWDGEGPINGNIIGKVFDTPDAYTFYNKYAFTHGFGIRKHWDYKNKMTNEVYRKCITHTKVTKHRSHGNFHRSMACKSLMLELGQSGMRPCYVKKDVNVMKPPYVADVTPKQCYDILSEQRKQYKADRRSRDAYIKLGDVVVFNVTYLTNKFKFPFAPFIGVNHRDQSILFGAALLENEKEETFQWLFEQFLMCMFDKYQALIITDQDKAICNAIRIVFPNTQHRYCSWHIKKHQLEHLRPFKARYNDFNESYNKWVKSDTIKEFETQWGVLRDKYNPESSNWMMEMHDKRGFGLS
ncbi:FAR1-related sequence 5-like protein [Tanacetum coccineum]|uniref:FAR1-related sequence 5-like protein n=1 Tax=Tanacetum coccineum TaxID=301880 RepID=A0ABQ5CT70_9ASTR